MAGDRLLFRREEIEQALNRAVDRWQAEHVGSTAYDVRLGEYYVRSGSVRTSWVRRVMRNERGQGLGQLSSSHGILVVEPGEYVLLTSWERFHMPANMRAEIGPKTTITRRGLIPLFGKTIDPGFEGVLILGYFNSSPIRQPLKFAETTICKIEFFDLGESLPDNRLTISHPDQREGRIPLDYYSEFFNHPEFNPVDLNRRLSRVEARVERIVAIWKGVVVVGLSGILLAVLVGVTYTLLADAIKFYFHLFPAQQPP